MLGDCELMAFVATVDGARARVFYEETLGLKVVADEPWALVLDARGTTLRVQKVEALSPPPHTALGWVVPDIAAAVRELVAKGLTFARYPFLEQDALGIWVSPSGGRIAWFKDPDGNTLSLTQL